MIKSLLAGALALALPLPQSAFPPSIYIQHPYIEKISCLEGSGTGFKLKSGIWVTAYHVARLTACQVDGKPIQVVQADPYHDFASFTVEDNRRGGMELNCSGFSEGQWTWGIGHGRGDPFPQIVAGRYSLFASFFAGRGWAVLEGNRFVPGMSGGAVVDQAGRVVGIVNAYGLQDRISFSLPMSRTPLCSQ